MGVKTQGTDLYAMDPEEGILIRAGCVTAIDGVDTTIEQIETTCLRNLTRTYEAGLGAPGNATFTIQTDPQSEDHMRLHAAKKAGRTLHWAIGWRQQSAIDDGVDPVDPDVSTDSDGDYLFDLPPERAWLVFEGYMSSFPFTWALNGVVTSNIGIQITGEPDLAPAWAS